MNISFKKNLNKNIMVIEKRENFSEHCFSAQMIMENDINNLLRFSYETIDDKTNFLYDISSKQVFWKQFENRKMTYENLRALCYSIKSLVDSLEEYLLEPNDIIMKKECIFTTTEANSYEFCYCPGYNGDIILELAELFNHVLQVIDYENEKVVKLAYEIHHRVQSEYFTVTDIMDALNESTNLVPMKLDYYDEIEEEIIDYDNEEDNYYLEDDSDKTFFEKVSLYLKGRNFIDVLDDINNKEFMYKVNEYGKDIMQPIYLSQSFMEETEYPRVKTSDDLDEIEFLDIKKFPKKKYI